MAFIALAVFGTPEVITEFILFNAGFISAVIAVVAIWQLTTLSTWSLWKQRVAVWLIAAAAAAVACSTPLALALLTKRG